MNGEIISMLAQGALPAARLDEPVLGPAPAADVTRFAEAMAAAPVHEPAKVAGVEPGSLLDTLRLIGHDYAQQTSELRAILAKDPSQFGPADMMKATFRMAETTIKSEMLRTAVQKTTQPIEQLSKL